MIRDAASAVAASICWLARWANSSPVKRLAAERHPASCGWCDWDRKDLMAMIEDFNQADIDGTVSLPFRRLSPNAQRSLVNAALYGQVAA